MGGHVSLANSEARIILCPPFCLIKDVSNRYQQELSENRFVAKKSLMYSKQLKGL